MSLKMPARLPVWLANIMLLALVLQLGWLGGQWTWRLLWPEVPVAGPISAASTDRDGSTRMSLSDLTLFGVPERGSDEIPDVVRQTARETSLQLTLHGVMLSTGESLSGAIVARDGRDSGYYRIGDELPGNATLVAVEAGRILLRRAGEVEALSFEDGGLQLASSGRRASREQAMPESTDAFLEMASEQLADNPEEALASAGLRPSGEGQAGYVYDGTNPMLSQMNLQPGDRILSINGHELGDATRDRDLMEQWANSQSLQVEIARGGTTFSFTVPVPR